MKKVILDSNNIVKYILPNNAVISDRKEGGITIDPKNGDPLMVVPDITLAEITIKTNQPDVNFEDVLGDKYAFDNGAYQKLEGRT